MGGTLDFSFVYLSDFFYVKKSVVKDAKNKAHLIV
jgi:hypothetical protein